MLSRRQRIKWHDCGSRNAVARKFRVSSNTPHAQYIVEMMWKVTDGGEDWNKCINSTDHHVGLHRLPISIQFEYRLYSIDADTAVVSYCRPPHNFFFFLVLLWQVISKNRPSFSCPFQFYSNDTRNTTSLQFRTEVSKYNRYFLQQKVDVYGMISALKTIYKTVQIS